MTCFGENKGQKLPFLENLMDTQLVMLSPIWFRVATVTEWIDKT